MATITTFRKDVLVILGDNPDTPRRWDTTRVDAEIVDGIREVSDYVPNDALKAVIQSNVYETTAESTALAQTTLTGESDAPIRIISVFVEENDGDYGREWDEVDSETLENRRFDEDDTQFDMTDTRMFAFDNSGSTQRLRFYPNIPNDRNIKTRFVPQFAETDTIDLPARMPNLQRLVKYYAVAQLARWKSYDPKLAADYQKLFDDGTAKVEFYYKNKFGLSSVNVGTVRDVT